MKNAKIREKSGPPSRRDKSAKKATSKRRTVASLAVEIGALRAEVEALRVKLTALAEGQKPPVVEAVLGAGATAASPASIHKTADEPKAVKPKPSPMVEVRAFVTDVFRLALVPLPDDEEARDELFWRFLSMVHSRRRGSNMLDQNNLSYIWDPLRQRPGIYLDEAENPGSFTVTRTQPAVVNARTERVKLFLQARARMPTPITVRRDPDFGGEWRIEASSL